MNMDGRSTKIPPLPFFCWNQYTQGETAHRWQVVMVLLGATLPQQIRGMPLDITCNAYRLGMSIDFMRYFGGKPNDNSTAQITMTGTAIPRSQDFSGGHGRPVTLQSLRNLFHAEPGQIAGDWGPGYFREMYNIKHPQIIVGQLSVRNLKFRLQCNLETTSFIFIRTSPKDHHFGTA